MTSEMQDYCRDLVSRLEARGIPPPNSIFPSTPEIEEDMGVFVDINWDTHKMYCTLADGVFTMTHVGKGCVDVDVALDENTPEQVCDAFERVWNRKTE